MLCIIKSCLVNKVFTVFSLSRSMTFLHGKQADWFLLLPNLKIYLLDL